MPSLTNRFDQLDLIPRDIESYLRSLPEFDGINILNFESGDRLDAENASFITSQPGSGDNPKQGIGIVIILARSSVEPCDHPRQNLQCTLCVVAVENTELNREALGGTGYSARQWALFILAALDGYHLAGFMQTQFKPAADGADALADINFHSDDDVVNNPDHRDCIATAACFDFEFINDIINRAQQPTLSVVLTGAVNELPNLLITVARPADHTAHITYDGTLPSAENLNATHLNAGSNSTTTNIQPGQTIVIRAVSNASGMLPSSASLAAFTLSEDALTLTPATNTI